MLLASAALLASGPRPASAELRVLDGDTLAIDGRRIRLFGIDAPEDGQRCTGANGRPYDCADAATRELRRLAAAGRIRCDARGQDRYHRQIAICYVNGADVGQQMVRRGWALAYRRYSTRYVADELVAEKNKLGMWAGSFTAPWDWRRQR